MSLLVFEDQIVDSLQEEAVDNRPLGQASKIGDYGGRMIPNGAYITGMLIAGLLGNRDGIEKAKVMTLGSIYAVSASTLLKYAIRESRPGDRSDRKSFPSGHTTAAFAFASVVGAEHGWVWGIPAYGLASLVALSRINDNKHYLHDVTAGATIGIAYGLGTWYLNHSKDSNDNGEHYLNVAPIWESAKKGVLLSLKL